MRRPMLLPRCGRRAPRSCGSRSRGHWSGERRILSSGGMRPSSPSGCRRMRLRGFLIAAAHSDSPTFKVRETAEVPSAGGMPPAKRGALRRRGDLAGLAGPAAFRGGTGDRLAGGRLVTRLVNVDRDLLVIPSVAIHMDRERQQGHGAESQGGSAAPVFRREGAWRLPPPDCGGGRRAGGNTCSQRICTSIRGRRRRWRG